MEYIASFASSFGLTVAQLLILAGLGFGVMVVFAGLATATSGPSAAAVRMNRPFEAKSSSVDGDIFRDEEDPTGLLKAFVPSAKSERTKIAKRMRQAGINRPNAVQIFYVVRTLLGLFLPMLLIGLMFLPAGFDPTQRLAGMFDNVGAVQSFQLLTGLVLAGFFGPSLWLNRMIRQRQVRIKAALPAVLDLMQVAIEAGMGFDAAIDRVARELSMASPDISDEFTMLQMEIHAGKDRDRAFLDMADRTGVDEMHSFVNVILQARQYGASVSKALMYFSEKMREDRELAAQEKANKLPVKMSAVMAAMMMPTLLMICLAPVAIRWMRMMG